MQPSKQSEFCPQPEQRSVTGIVWLCIATGPVSRNLGGPQSGRTALAYQDAFVSLSIPNVVSKCLAGYAEQIVDKRANPHRTLEQLIDRPTQSMAEPVRI